MLLKLSLLLATCFLLTLGAKPELHCEGDCLIGPDRATMAQVMALKEKEWEHCAEEHLCPDGSAQKMAATKCINGKAGEYECKGVDLLSFTPLKDLGATGDANDIWGWTDTVTGDEYVISCHYTGTTFVRVTDPENPEVLGRLPTKTVSSSWRDVKVYDNHAFIISEASRHGMQVFDLTRLRFASFRATWTEDAYYGEFGNCHNIVINEDTGFAYGVGSSTCRGGLHMIDIRDPKNPSFAGCYADDGYCHDAQCVVYDGPDTTYRGREICFMYDEDSLTIVDVTVKAAPSLLSRTLYSGSQYTHQGWLTADQTHLLLNDELDELKNSNSHTRTMLWDVNSLTKPFLQSSYYSDLTVIDHNLYIIDDIAYLANYCGGLRIYKFASDYSQKESAYFDVAPNCQSTTFLGAWSSYPYFASGTVAVNSIERGLFLVKLQDCAFDNTC